MIFKSLTIRRTESYQTPANTLVGTVDMVDEGGSAITVALSYTAIISILGIIQDEAKQRALAAAKKTGYALQDACAELAILTHPAITGEAEE